MKSKSYPRESKKLKKAEKFTFNKKGITYSKPIKFKVVYVNNSKFYLCSVTIFFTNTQLI